VQRTFLKFVIYTPTNSSGLLLTIIRSSLCWRYKSYPLKERIRLAPPTQGIPGGGWQQVANSHDLLQTIIMNAYAGRTSYILSRRGCHLYLQHREFLMMVVQYLLCPLCSLPGTTTTLQSTCVQYLLCPVCFLPGTITTLQSISAHYLLCP
jgi:hypothetical protein